MRKAIVLAGLAVVTTAGLATPALAAEAASLDRIIDLYKNGAAGWENAFATVAMRLFYLLAAIEVGISFARMGLKQADLGEWAAEIINRALFIGFFSWLLLNAGDFTQAIIDSFRQAANQAAVAGGGSGGLRPSDIFDAGVQMASKIMSAKTEGGLAGIGQHIVLMAAGGIVVFCFALMAAYLIQALVESYIVTTAGVIMFGLGGSRFTKDYAVKALTYGVSVGAKLMVIQLLVGIGEATIKSFAAALNPASLVKPEDVFVVLGFAAVLMILTKTIPEHVQSMINGVSTSTAGGGMLAAAVGGAVGAAVGGAAGFSSAMVNSTRLASQQIKDEGGREGIGRTLSAIAGRSAMNLAHATTADFGARLGGQARAGSMGGRMGEQMNRERRELARASGKPMPPVGGGDKQAEKATASAGAKAEDVIRPATAATGSAAGVATAAQAGANTTSAQSGAATNAGEGARPDSPTAGASASTGAQGAPGQGPETIHGAGSKEGQTDGHPGAAADGQSSSPSAASTVGQAAASQAANVSDVQSRTNDGGLGSRMGGSNTRAEPTKSSSKPDGD